MELRNLCTKVELRQLKRNSNNTCLISISYDFGLLNVIENGKICSCLKHGTRVGSRGEKWDASIKRLKTTAIQHDYTLNSSASVTIRSYPQPNASIQSHTSTNAISFLFSKRWYPNQHKRVNDCWCLCSFYTNNEARFYGQ